MFVEGSDGIFQGSLERFDEVRWRLSRGGDGELVLVAPVRCERCSRSLEYSFSTYEVAAVAAGLDPKVVYGMSELGRDLCPDADSWAMLGPEFSQNGVPKMIFQPSGNPHAPNDDDDVCDHQGGVMLALELRKAQQWLEQMSALDLRGQRLIDMAKLAEQVLADSDAHHQEKLKERSRRFDDMMGKSNSETGEATVATVDLSALGTNEAVNAIREEVVWLTSWLDCRFGEDEGDRFLPGHRHFRLLMELLQATSSLHDVVEQCVATVVVYNRVESGLERDAAIAWGKIRRYDNLNVVGGELEFSRTLKEFFSSDDFDPEGFGREVADSHKGVPSDLFWSISQLSSHLPPYGESSYQAMVKGYQSGQRDEDEEDTSRRLERALGIIESCREAMASAGHMTTDSSLAEKIKVVAQRDSQQRLQQDVSSARANTGGDKSDQELDAAESAAGFAPMSVESASGSIGARWVDELSQMLRSPMFPDEAFAGFRAVFSERDKLPEAEAMANRIRAMIGRALDEVLAVDDVALARVAAALRSRGVDNATTDSVRKVMTLMGDVLSRSVGSADPVRVPPMSEVLPWHEQNYVEVVEDVFIDASKRDGRIGHELIREELSKDSGKELGRRVAGMLGPEHTIALLSMLSDADIKQLAEWIQEHKSVDVASLRGSVAKCVRHAITEALLKLKSRGELVSPRLSLYAAVGAMLEKDERLAAFMMADAISSFLSASRTCGGSDKMKAACKRLWEAHAKLTQV